MNIKSPQYFIKTDKLNKKLLYLNSYLRELILTVVSNISEQ